MNTLRVVWNDYLNWFRLCAFWAFIGAYRRYRTCKEAKLPYLSSLVNLPFFMGITSVLIASISGYFGIWWASVILGSGYALTVFYVAVATARSSDKALEDMLDGY